LNTDGSYKSETAWAGSGGGISSIWKAPTWQSGLATASNKGSTSMRMLPDISANADPNTGYAIYVSGGWSIYGGTSCATPIWAAFNALVNQQRLAAGKSVLGFPSPALYQSGVSGVYGSIFHDINNNSSNGFYPAVSGFDLATGWGSMNGPSLAASLSGVTLPPGALTGFTITPHNQVLTLSWSASIGAASYSIFKGTSSSGPFTELSASTTGTSFDDSSLTNGVSYYYYLVAENSGGSGAQSTVVAGAPQSMAPRAPTSIQAK
jgi:kumamolisin